jgi:S-adenosylmethionine uptake transporter
MPADTATAAQTAAQTVESSSRQSLWMILAAFAFSAMGVCVKLASAHYSTGEIVFYRSVIGMTLMGAVLAKTGAGIRTPYLTAHIKRSVFGVTSLLLWFTSISLLPLATAMTLNYMSPVWIALIMARVLQWPAKPRAPTRRWWLRS